MKNILILLMNLIFGVCVCQSQTITDTIKSNINVTFDELPTGGVEMYIPILQISYVHANKKVVLFFEVPNYGARYKTTTADYAIIKLKEKEIRLQNLVESDADGIIQKFTLQMSKDGFLELFHRGLRKITFYFEPNEEFIVKRLESEKNLNPKYKQLIIEDAKKTVSSIIGNPNKKELQTLINWLQKL